MRPVKYLFLAALIAGAAQAAPVKIGFLSTFSGPGAALGIDQYDGFMLAVDQEHGRLGGVEVSIIKEDDEMKPDKSIQIARQFLMRDQVDIVTGVVFSNVMMAVHRPITSAQTFLIGANAGPTPIAGAGCSPYFFSTSWNNDQLHEAAGELMNRMGIKRVYLLAPNYQAGKDALEGFKRTFKGEVAGEILSQINQTDYSAEITTVMAHAPEAIYTFYPGGMGVNFTKQYQQAGMMTKIPMVSTSSIDGSTLPALKNAALGAITSSPYAPDLDNAANQAFAPAFRAKYGREPSLYAAQSYDAARLIASALKRTQGKVQDKDRLREALKAADFDSVRGYFAFNTNQFPISPFYRVDVIKNAQGEAALSNQGVIFEKSQDAYAAACPMR
ncbi:ABC transporter substrate-binding protein [Pusillimonas sp. CC-YST705]|uniref:ABC transporter substrate-binding protein n=1 Tax=Mesopusillimonas faecipullorum TaxID=2755040 RepID=A0ABS8CBT7_9BURK|nr:ABC transporter substrate-binding protein [Mesopusillimonas faecipullorum]MCB5363317.1 ABC transporter substrate-binding protein [Mesopusillimonas faecipullorum]